MLVGRGEEATEAEGALKQKSGPETATCILSLMLAELHRLCRKPCTAGGLLSAETLDPGPIFSGTGDCPGGSERSYDTFWKRRT